MKLLVVLSGLFLAPWTNPHPETAVVKGKETLIDKINRADKVPVYFVTNEVLYNNQVTKVKPNPSGTGSEIKNFSTCGKIEETASIPEEFQGARDQVISELNRVFKTDKFVMSDASTIPTTDKGGMTKFMGGEIANKITPNLKAFDFSGVGDPVFVLCALTGVYSSDALFDTGDIGKVKMKEYKEEEIEIGSELDVYLTSYVTVRLLSYDAKKKKTTYEDPTFFSAEQKSSETMKQTSCISSISELTSQINPASQVSSLNSEIEGMFDDRAARLWKKQK